MSTIQSPQAIKFCNEKVRIVADQMSQLYYISKSIKDYWNANNLINIIPYDSMDILEDGSDKDGRPQINAIQVNNILNRCDEIITLFESDNNARLNTILQVSVNQHR
jgi:hypothetical protein